MNEILPDQVRTLKTQVFIGQTLPVDLENYIKCAKIYELNVTDD